MTRVNKLTSKLAAVNTGIILLVAAAGLNAAELRIGTASQGGALLLY